MKTKYLLPIIILILAQTGFARNIQCVWTKSANVRAGAGMENKILFKAWRYEPLTVLESKGDWVKIAEHYRGTGGKKVLKGEHPEGLIGWVHKSLIKRARCLSVRSGVLNIRSGPSTGYKTISKVKWGYSFKYLEKQGVWYKVTDGSTTGWLHSGFVWSPWF